MRFAARPGLRAGLPSWGLMLCLAAVANVLSPGRGSAQESADYFRQNCASCHTIGGGRLTGPDLKNVTSAKEREWLIAFILNPKGVIDGGDLEAQKLVQEARGVVMPTTFGITRDRAEALLNLIEAESKLERSQFAGVQISHRPFTQADRDRGREIFLGHTRLVQGGPSCLGCHRANGMGLLGGGRLGPDLTKVYERLHGRKELAAWLSAPATPTMQPVYKQHPLQAEEILALVAFFEDCAKNGREDSGVAMMNFFLLGLGGAAGGLVLFDVLWRRRFRTVRRALVNGDEQRGAA